jgi:hypothetical protein
MFTRFERRRSFVVLSMMAFFVSSVMAIIEEAIA